MSFPSPIVCTEKLLPGGEEAQASVEWILREAEVAFDNKSVLLLGSSGTNPLSVRAVFALTTPAWFVFHYAVYATAFAYIIKGGWSRAAIKRNQTKNVLVLEMDF